MFDPSERIRFIGLFNDSFPPVMDGVTNTVVNYARWLDARRENPVVVTPRNPVDGEYPYPVLRYFSLPIRSRFPYRYGYPKLDLRIWSELRKREFSIVHAHSPFSSGRLGVYVKKHQHVPLIGTFHSKYRDDLEQAFHGRSWMVNIIMRRILDFFNACDEVWIPQAEVEETVREYGFRGPLQVVDNGIEFADMPLEEVARLRRSYRLETGISDSRLVLLFVGQHILQKGVDVIIEALTLLPPGLDWEMNFVGSGYFMSEMKRMVLERGISDRVRFHGVLQDREMLSRIYAASDLFLFPSLYDNAPLVVREAAALLTPSLLAEGSTASHVVKPGRNGFLCERSPRAIAEMTVRLAEDRASLAEVALNARNSIVRSWRDVVDEVSDRYRSLISRTR